MMLQTLKWTESFFMGLAIVLIALAVVAVPSNHVWGDDPIDPGGVGTPNCKSDDAYCQSTADKDICKGNATTCYKQMCYCWQFSTPVIECDCVAVKP